MEDKDSLVLGIYKIEWSAVARGVTIVTYAHNVRK